MSKLTIRTTQSAEFNKRVKKKGITQEVYFNALLDVDRKYPHLLEEHL